MISSAPATAASNLLTVREKIVAFVATAKLHAKDGVTIAEFAELTVSLMRIVIAAADDLPETGIEKKEWVVEAVGLLFDDLAGLAVPAVAWPVWVLVRPAVRQLVLLAVSGAVESLLPLVRMAA